MGASYSSELNQMETELIIIYNELARRLDEEYTNHIFALLKQKSLILDNLQKQFIERRDSIKQTISNQSIVHRYQNEHNHMLHPLESDHTLNGMNASFISNPVFQISCNESLNHTLQNSNYVSMQRSKTLRNKKNSKNEKKLSKIRKM